MLIISQNNNILFCHLVVSCCHSNPSYYNHGNHSLLTLQVDTLLETLQSAVEDVEMTTQNGNGHAALNGLLVDLVDALRSNVDIHVTKEVRLLYRRFQIIIVTEL